MLLPRPYLEKNHVFTMHGPNHPPHFHAERKLHEGTTSSRKIKSFDPCVCNCTYFTSRQRRFYGEIRTLALVSALVLRR